MKLWRNKMLYPCLLSLFCLVVVHHYHDNIFTMRMEPHLHKHQNQAVTNISFSEGNSQYSWQIKVWSEAYNSGNYSSNNEIAERLFKKPRPSSPLVDVHAYPFLSHTTLQAYTDWNILYKTISPGTYKPKGSFFRDGDSIFVKNRPDIMRHFVTKIVPKLNGSFVLLTGQTDYPAPGRMARLLHSKKLIRWFAQNADRRHPKLEPMPLGLTYISREPKHGPKPSLGNPKTLAGVVWPEVPFHQQNRTGDRRSILSYINFSVYRRDQQPARFVANKVLGGISLKRKDLTIQEYIQDVKKSKFVVSPPGLGWDCYRTWESILLGAIPIVLKSAGMAPLYRVSPVLVVNNWREADDKEKLLNYKLNTINKDVVMVDYWLHRIQLARQNYFKTKQPL